MKGHVWFGGLVAGVALALGTVGGAVAQTPTPAPGASAPAPQSLETIPAEIQGDLRDGDAVLPSDNSLYDAYVFQGKAGDMITITMESNQFDTYLGLLDAAGAVIRENDDVSEGVTNSQIQVRLPRDGEYTVIANGFDSTSRGSYSLQINVGQ